MAASKGLVGLVEEWRKKTSPYSAWDDAADELQPFLERLEALEESMKGVVKVSLDTHGKVHPNTLGNFAHALHTILHGSEPKRRALQVSA